MAEQDPYQLAPLLQRLQQGDRTALDELFTRLRPFLHALVKRTLGEDWNDASDIVQSSLRRINDHLDGLLGGDAPTVHHLLAWVKKIVRNRAIDEVRRRSRAPAALGDSQMGELPEVITPADRIGRDERAVSILQALEQLPPRHRQVVELHYFDRLRDEEISQRLGGSVAAIRVLRCRALKTLRGLMEVDHGTE